MSHARVVYGKRQTSTAFSHIAMFQSAQPRLTLSDGSDSEHSGMFVAAEDGVESLSKRLEDLQVREDETGRANKGNAGEVRPGALTTISANATKLRAAKEDKDRPRRQVPNLLPETASEHLDMAATGTRARRRRRPCPAETSTEEFKPRKTRQRQRAVKSSEVEGSDETACAIKRHIAPLVALCTANSKTDKSPAAFQDWANRLEPYFNVSKIAEASYGEVYRLSLKITQTGFTNCDESVVKIIPITPPPVVLARRLAKPCTGAVDISQMSKPVDVASEIRLLQRMTAIPGFTNFRDLRIVQGRPPSLFANAWKAWNKMQPSNMKSLFPDPTRKSNYAETQLWAVVEMQDAGADLEAHPRRDVWSAWDLFWGVAVALAKGEEGARFEHRDLHLGNVCVKPSVLGQASKDRCKWDHDRNLGFSGLETTIIDYTFSRADVDGETGDGRGQVAYLDLERDPAIFSGDASLEYQYEIYRYMRGIVLYDDPCHPSSADQRPSEEENTQLWQNFHPRTNLVWLHYLLYEMCRQVQVWPSAFAHNDWADGDWTIAAKLEDRLLDLQELLQVEELHNTWTASDSAPDDTEQDVGPLNSAADLIALAIQEGWLDVDDVVGLGIPSSPSPPQADHTDKRSQCRRAEQ